MRKSKQTTNSKMKKVDENLLLRRDQMEIRVILTIYEAENELIFLLFHRLFFDIFWLYKKRDFCSLFLLLFVSESNEQKRTTK